MSFEAVLIDYTNYKGERSIRITGMDESTHLDTESLPPESFMRPSRRRLRLRCLRCGHEYFSKPFTGAPPRIDPPCPQEDCRIEREVERRLADDERMRRIIEEGRAPAHNGRNPVVGAIDRTAAMVMQDHKLTNLNDNMREGDIAAPRLPMGQQRAADAFFTGQEVARRAGGRRMQMRVAQLGAQILGARAPMPAVNIKAIQAAAASPGDAALVMHPTPDPFLVKMVPRR